MRYRCLILDHDDTAVDSTGFIHYPSFIAALKELRPEQADMSLETFIGYCFKPGFTKLCTDIMQFSPAEQRRQQEIWRQYNQARHAEFFSSFPELVQRFKKAGGLITVVT